ncbi:MAG: DNA repair protein RecN [Alphaproteobacteria bacterium]|nr:DNA repair protein RecN [Alphaproteobacteria bacterium]
MLTRLSIRDLVLIEAVDIDFDDGLVVLTGETGAGKSILLDGLGLALGDRAEQRLVRDGANQAVVTAVFALAPGHPARAMLVEAGHVEADEVVLRRVLTADGRSRALVNDQAATVGFLAALGETLVEVHGQGEARGLLRPETHRAILDAFGGHQADVAALATAYGHARAARAAHAAVEAAARDGSMRAAELERTLEQFAELEPKPGEEAELASTRTRLNHAQKLAEILEAARAELADGHAVEARLRAAHRAIARGAGVDPELFRGIADALDRCLNETGEAIALIDAAGRGLVADPARQERIEQRLFGLRALARKHRVEVDALAGLETQLLAELASLEDRESAVKGAAEAMRAADADFVVAAKALGAARAGAAKRLDAAVMGELKPLKLDRASFRTRLAERPREAWTAEGAETVSFEVATNPGAPPGPLHKIASGGELARFMLVLKVVLAKVGTPTTLVFDEVDAGVGGAVADAVGARLARLGRAAQVLVVTHAPQVAARGHQHLRVMKDTRGGRTRIAVATLDASAKGEEIARMLAGARVTDEARAAAASLIRAGAS